MASFYLDCKSGEKPEHLYTLARYVERNARVNLTRRAENWRWGSLFRWLRGSAEDHRLLASWPLPRQPGWVEHVNEPLTEAKLAAVQRSVQRGSPLGSEAWCERTTAALQLEITTRPRGRPKRKTT